MGIETGNLEIGNFDSIYTDQFTVGVENPYALLLVVPVMLFFYVYLKKKSMHGAGMNRKKMLFIFSRFLIVIALSIALASPYMLETTEVPSEINPVTILFDRSESMSLYENTDNDNTNNFDTNNYGTEDMVNKLSNNLKTRLGNESVILKYFSEGNRTGIGDALYQEAIGDTIKAAIKPKPMATDTSGSSLKFPADTLPQEFQSNRDLLVLVSDGNNNYGRNALDVSRALKGTTSLFTLSPDSPGDEIYIKEIVGEKKVSANSDYELAVKIAKIGKDARYRMFLRVEGRTIKIIERTQTNLVDSISINISFDDVGVYGIVAEIMPLTNDHFSQNNKMLKVVDVIEKPDILVITNDKISPLITVLEKNYRVSLLTSLENSTGNSGNSGNSNRIPIEINKLDDYDAVFIDNQDSGKLIGITDALHSYVSDGNGLVVIGGDSAYEQGDYQTAYNQDKEKELKGFLAHYGKSAESAYNCPDTLPLLLELLHLFLQLR